MQNEVLEFINRRFNKDENWCNGNCYWFSLILCIRFPRLRIYYEPVVGHFVAGCDDEFYDWNGRYTSSRELILFDCIKKEDPLWYERLVRDCVM